MRHRGALIMTLPLSLLLGCSDPTDDGGTVGGLTATEAERLNDAAQMLDVGNRPPLPTNSQAAEVP
ncbi:MAG: hypothetical protein AB7L36_03350 [Sphingomonadaceae bacterium]